MPSQPIVSRPRDGVLVGPGRPAGNATQAVRILRIYEHLRKAVVPVRVAELAGIFGVHVKTLRRDLRAIDEARISWRIQRTGVGEDPVVVMVPRVDRRALKRLSASK